MVFNMDMFFLEFMFMFFDLVVDCVVELLCDVVGVNVCVVVVEICVLKCCVECMDGCSCCFCFGDVLEDVLLCVVIGLIVISFVVVLWWNWLC